MINKILFITLSNIGDAILTLPALDYLRAQFPQAQITVVSAERPKEIFLAGPRADKVIIYDKKAGLAKQIAFYFVLKKEHFDLVIDLRNTFLGALLSLGTKTRLFARLPKGARHMRDIHLYKTRALITGVEGAGQSRKLVGTEHCSVPRRTAQCAVPTGKPASLSLCIRPQDQDYIEGILNENGVTVKDRIVVVAAGARSDTKKWPKEKFAELVRGLINIAGVKVVLAGDSNDLAAARHIAGNCALPLLNLSGKTDIMQLAVLLKRAALLVTNDSAVMHLAGYLDVPTLALFGPTDPDKYGPWSSKSAVVRYDLPCRPCGQAQCRFQTLECLRAIEAVEVLRKACDILGNGK